MNEDAWDTICVNPHEDQLAAGRTEGHEAGLKSGYSDGLDLGMSKGVEYGIELGFIRRSCQLLALRDAERQFTSRVDDILQALTDFPQPEQLFHEESGEKVDLQNEMQRIRAKFKVLTTQLKMPQYSLKQVLTVHSAVLSTEW
mmetsp:Transcript_29271/g.48380  ORF Transcript_29271/g.48380 Transcript_29271/m.48380 type:complete len:143 (-) Transcript_29271:1440-1868(-)